MDATLKRSIETQALLKEGGFPNPLDIRVLDEDEFYTSLAYRNFRYYMDNTRDPKIVFFNKQTYAVERYTQIGSDLAEVYAYIRMKLKKGKPPSDCVVM